jgi:hypothetical protein
MADELWSGLEELGHELGYADPRGSRSQLVREMISATITKWREAPYICRSARHIFLVTANGDVFYRTDQVLKLNSYRERLPCGLEMKPEKRRDFLLNRDVAVEEAEWFRSRWLLNHFAVWHGETIGGPPLGSWIDRDGTDAKLADLVINQRSGRVLTREVLVGLRDYVQWQTGGRDLRAPTPAPESDDRLDIAIDIPTRNLDIFVMVDTGLYRHNADTEEELALLGVEFRNREGARFKGREPARDPENPMEVHTGRKLDDVTDANAEQVRREVSAMQRRILDLCEAPDGEPLCPTREARNSLLRTLEIPSHFLYCRASWPSPYFGIEICVTWEKPLQGGGA